MTIAGSRDPLFVALAAVLVLGAIVSAIGPAGGSDLFRGFESPAVALQAARDAHEIEMVVREPGSGAWKATRLQVITDYALALSYGFAFWVMGSRLKGRGGAAFLQGCAICAAAMNVGQNVLLMRSLPSTGVVFHEGVIWLARAKWTAIGIACLLAIRLWAPPFPVDDQRKAFSILAVAFYLMAGVAALGGNIWPGVWERFGLPFAMALLISAGVTLARATIDAAQRNR